jgi:hypothetical protein
MDRSFRVFFRRKRQFFDVYLHNTTPATFNRRGGGHWGYFVPRWTNPKVGLFGEIHLVQSRVRHDSVLHELDHLRCAWLFGNRVSLSTRNEEWFCRFGDEIIRNFYREFENTGEK